MLNWIIKEARCEFRSKQGLLNSLIFGFMSVIIAVFATAQQKFSPDLAAGFLASILVFSAIVTVPRLFLIEEDQKTFDLARLIAPPSVIFTGKAIFVTTTLGCISGGLAFLFASMTKVQIFEPLYLLGSSLTFASGLSLCLCMTSAMVMGAQNRTVLSAVVATPLLLPLVFVGVGTFRFAFGIGSQGAANQNLLVMIAYIAAIFALGPILVDYVWDKPVSPSTNPSNRT